MEKKWVIGPNDEIKLVPIHSMGKCIGYFDSKWEAEKFLITNLEAKLLEARKQVEVLEMRYWSAVKEASRECITTTEKI